MLLKHKVAVIYGAGGGVGGAVARAFAREGANVFLTGRHRAPVEAVVKDIVLAGGSAEARRLMTLTIATRVLAPFIDLRGGFLARGDGERGGVHGVRQRERDDGNYREPDDGQVG
ncbi:MAG: SDR family NAD(P)-dependent oxidoreductase [Gemmatimonadota bacterium]